MAAQSMEDFLCLICYDVFTDPVVLTCSHSFCKDCVERWWEGKQIKECPVCKRRHSQRDLTRNLALRNLCEGLMLERDQSLPVVPEATCKLHSESFKLFCLDHQQPVCVVCRDSRAHNNHRFSPVNEAAQDHKEKLRKSLKPIQEKLKLCEQVKGNWTQTAEHIKVEAQHTEKQIREKFRKLHQFLLKEEEARITALREEEEQKSQMMKEKIEALSKEITGLSHVIRATEKELRAENVSFLQNYKAAVKRVQLLSWRFDPQQVSGALIDEAKHLGNLTFNIWNRMQEMVSYTPVILDPNTAHPELILSEDLTSVKHGEKQKLPENPERLDDYPALLGSEGFNSEIHSWDVEVGHSPVWALGVIAESVLTSADRFSRIFRIVFCDGKYTAYASSGVPAVVPVTKKFQRIRVLLDCNNGKLSFTDADTDTHIHTFIHTFTERMFPYFNTVYEHPLKILQTPIFITI
ncbi:tripartite motif-containing protein 35-like [Anabas testudineus]|uniref:Tripartite motif containing 35-12 n=1 Tax=Anabas testudineus TaxID=64144 RepID=A0A3Q1HP59_ANATE|nr:tripartite motif-containing protein 35-like [Anabas testudineus]